MSEESSDTPVTSPANEPEFADGPEFEGYGERAGVTAAAEPPAPTPQLTKQQMIQARRNRGAAFYRLSVDLAQSTKRALNGVLDEQVEGTLGAYLKLMNPPVEEGQTTIPVEKEVLQQLAMFAATYLARYTADRYRR